MKRTKRQKYEYVLGTSNGLCFGIIDRNYDFKESLEDQLIPDKDVSSFVEYEKDKFLVSVYKDMAYILLIDRQEKDKIIQITHPSKNVYKTVQLQQIFFFPFVFVRDEYNVTLIDIKRQKVMHLLKNKECFCDIN